MSHGAEGQWTCNLRGHMVYYFLRNEKLEVVSVGKKAKNTGEQELPVLEINPSEEYHPRPMWQRVAAWILIALIVLATGIFALWGEIV